MEVPQRQHRNYYNIIRRDPWSHLKKNMYLYMEKHSREYTRIYYRVHTYMSYKHISAGKIDKC